MYTARKTLNSNTNVARNNLRLRLFQMGFLEIV